MPNIPRRNVPPASVARSGSAEYLPGRREWLPIALVVLFLLALFVVPIVDQREIEQPWAIITGVDAPAHGLVHEIGLSRAREAAAIRDFSLTGLLGLLVIGSIGLSIRLGHRLRKRVREEIALRRELEESEARYRSVIENIPHATYSIDTEGRILSANPAAERITGYRLEEFYGKPFTPLIAPEDLPRVMEHFRRAVAGEPQTFECRVVTRDGRRVTLQMTGVPIIVQGEVVGVYGIAEDITERKRAEKALRESEERFRQLADHIQEKFWISNADGSKIFYMSPAYEEIWGRPVQIVYENPRAWLEAVHPEDRPRVEAALQGLARGEYDVEYRVVRPDGEVRWVWSRGFPVEDEQGVVYRVVGIAEDITERKGLEQERADLLERERRTRAEAERRAREETALRRATEAVTASYTVEEVIEQIARSALEATNADGAFVTRIDIRRNEAEIVATAGSMTPPVRTRVPYPGTLTKLAVEREEPQVFDDLARAGRPVPEPLARICEHCAVVVIPLIDGGEAIGALFLLRGAATKPFQPDEVARARTFGDLAALAFHKVHLLEDSERKREELLRVMESRSRLMRGFTHDVKNPLGAADGHLQLLEEGILGELAEQQKVSVGRVRRSIHSALELIGSLIELARAEAERIEIKPTAMDVRRAAHEIAEEYRARAEAEDLSLELDLPDELPGVRSDPSRVNQILSNLLSNAVKYTPAGGRITVRAAARSGDRAPGPGRWIVVDISDTGPGIPREKQHLLFQEFTRLEPGTERGAGLGLAISKRVAEALGGDITVESEAGKGCTFTLWLPLEEVEAAGPDTSTSQEAIGDSRREAQGERHG